MRQIVQLEGSQWCAALSCCMVLDHFAAPWDLALAQKRFAEFERQSVSQYDGCHSDRNVASYLTEQGLDVLYTEFGLPMVRDSESNYLSVSHEPRENRIATWYAVYSMIRSGYVAAVAIERDHRKGHFVCVDDAFLRAGEHWFSMVDPLRGAYEEQAERFMLTVKGKGDAIRWIFAKKRPARFASAAEIAVASEEAKADGQMQ